MVTNPNLDTQPKLANKSGLSQQHISRLLRCEASATTDALVQIARALKCEPWELLTDDQAIREAVYKRVIGGLDDEPKRKGRAASQ